MNRHSASGYMMLH